MNQKRPKRYNQPEPSSQINAVLGWGAAALVAFGIALATYDFASNSQSTFIGGLLNSEAQQSDDALFTASIEERSPEQIERENILLQIRNLRDRMQAFAASERAMTKRIGELEAAIAVLEQETSDNISTPTDNSTQAFPAQDKPSATQPSQTLPDPIDGREMTGSLPSLVRQESSPTSISFAIDLGRAVSISEARADWETMKEQYKGAVDLSAFEPLVLIQDNKEGVPSLRILAGPFRDAGDAAMSCARLLGAGLETCAPSFYEGQKLFRSGS
jgi:hypothetical protein